MIEFVSALSPKNALKIYFNRSGFCFKKLSQPE